MRTVTLIYYLFFLIVASTPSHGQNGQISISRITQMPNLPSPYNMRNWKDVALQYDEFIFNNTSAGQYLPLLHLKTSGANYPTLQPILLDSYVGSTSAGNQAEAINIMPAIIGASLVGVNKSNQNGIDWVSKIKDFYNKANGQNVYLNSYSTVSGSDWWYDLMPNIYFYQLNAQYPATSDFNTQFTSIADRWLGAVYVMGGAVKPWTVPSMNYRAFKLATQTPNNMGVNEPEAAGAIGWLLYHAYLKTGEKKYFEGAQMAMEFLSGLSSDPSYELQLPYGSFIAAKMNAEAGTNYDITKLVNWSFERGPLRGWGTIVGNWNGSDVSGLIGEANDQGNDYAFVMNGFQQASALVPMVKYDKRFAHDIAKWMLNLANASRLFYSAYLPQSSQDDFAWSSAHDPQSVIAYEALKENISGKKLYATGDAKPGGWAQTNLSLYSSSSVGYLAAVVNTSDVAGMLLLDVNKTDFYGQNIFPAYLVYNPYAVAKQVTVNVGNSNVDIYDAITESILATAVTGNVLLTVPADEVRYLVYVPGGSILTAKNNKLYIGNTVVDYHYGYTFQNDLRIKSLEASDTLVEFNKPVTFFASVDNALQSTTYSWFVNDVQDNASSDNTLHWISPGVAGNYKISVRATSGLKTAKDSLTVSVVAHIPLAPKINSLTPDKKWYHPGEIAKLTCIAENTESGSLHYSWSVPVGAVTSDDNAAASWTLPPQAGLYTVTCAVKNDFDVTVNTQLSVLVEPANNGTTDVLAYYPLDGDVKDHSGNGYDASINGTKPATDARGSVGDAYAFSSGDDIIVVPDQPALNFQSQITLSCWVNITAAGAESFILSHGSWEERWKLSIIPNGKLRWTVKTDVETKDLDTSFPLVLNQFYHITASYTGYSMQLYVDGLLDSYAAHTGLMATTAKSITFGQKNEIETSYHLNGTLDEVRIYKTTLSPEEILTLKTIWNSDVVSGVYERANNVIIYPNPSHTGAFDIAGLDPTVNEIELIDVTGKSQGFTLSTTQEVTRLVITESHPGIFILVIKSGFEVIHRRVVMY